MVSNPKKNGSKTSSFGSPSRANHDSSKFYNGKLYEGLPKEKENVDFRENLIPTSSLDNIFCKSSEKMSELPDNSIHLMVTSPPLTM